MSEVSTRGKSYFLSSESKPQGRVEIFDNIEDATLFVFWKFAHHFEKELDKTQVSYSLFHSPKVFSHSNMLKKFLNDGNNSLAVKFKKMLGFMQQRVCRQNAPCELL